MTVQTTSLKHAVHSSVRNPKVGKPKTRSEMIVAHLVRDGLLPFRVSLPEYAAISFAGLMRDLHAGWGASGALAPIEFGMGGSDGTGRISQPRTYSDEMLRADHTISALNNWERQLLAWLIKANEKHGVSLTKMGKELYGDAPDNIARERATTRIQALADSVYQHYPQASIADGYRLHVKHQDQKKTDAWHQRRSGVPIAA